MIHQVTFLIEGYLLPLTMGRLRVSEKLILENVLPTEGGALLSYDQKFFTIAYVGVSTPGEANPFPIAWRYLDFFLMIYSLVSGQSVTARIGIGITLDDLSSLDTKRFDFPSFQEIHMLGEHKNSIFNKPILEAKKRFLLLLPDMRKIMDSFLGLALTYYYLAVRASGRRFDEAIIHLMISAEALLITETKYKRKNLSRRLSMLIAEDEAEVKKISEDMLKLYELRSGIIHGGGKKPTRVDVRILFDYVRRAIERGLYLRHLSKKELVAKLDEAYVHPNKRDILRRKE